MNKNRVGYMPHNGVMKEEISSILDDVPPGIFIDSTYGYGSHFDTIMTVSYTHLTLPTKA